MGSLDLHVRSSVPMGALGRLGQRVEPGEAAPVSAQSTSKASDVDHKALALNSSLNSCVRACVCVYAGARSDQVRLQLVSKRRVASRSARMREAW